MRRSLTEGRTRKDCYEGSSRKADMMANAQSQIRRRTRKGRYEGKRAKAVRGTAEGEGYSKRLILGSGFKIADLIRESKRKFELVVRLIANECYEDTFYFLSFLPTVLRLPSSHTRLIY